jgi:hypothetical protein
VISLEAQKLAQERAARMKAAIELREPDRVPFMGVAGDVVAAYSGLTSYEFNFDYEKSLQATIKFLTDFPSDGVMFGGMSNVCNLVMCIAFADYPDLATSMFMVTGPLNDILGVKYCRFPGRELDEDSSPQFIGDIYMQPEEYDELIADPVKFSMEKMIPRTVTNLQDLGSPTALATMARWGMEKARQNAEMMRLGAEMAKLGYPPSTGAFAYAPLDYIGDFLRDIPSLILDLRRYPDKVKAACESILEVLLKITLEHKKLGAEMAMFPLHLNVYLSPELYKEFFWPTLKEFVLRLREHGMRSEIFFEGRHDPHLETILELPAGWGTAYFEKTDIRKAKKLLQGHTCIMGGLEAGVVIGSTPAQIDEHVKRLLGDMMPGGGFILCLDVANLPRNTPIENIAAVYEAVEKYGKY